MRRYNVEGAGPSLALPPSSLEVILHSNDKRKTHGTEAAQGEDTGGAQGAGPARAGGRRRAAEGAASGYRPGRPGRPLWRRPDRDAAASGVRQAEHRVERLLGKGKKSAAGPSVDVALNEPPAPAEDTPAHLSAEQRPRIKTREAVRPSSATPAQGQPAQTASKPAVKTEGNLSPRESGPPTEPPSQAGQAAGQGTGRIAARDLVQRRGRPEVKSAPQSDGRVASSHKAGGKAGEE